MGRPVTVAVLIAGVEVRRSWRRLAKRSRFRLLKLLLLAAAIAVYTAVAGGAGLVAGAFVQRGAAPIDPIAGARAVVVGLFAIVGFFSVQRALKGKAIPDGSDLLLTSTSHRPVAAGLLLAECVRVIVVGAAPIFAFAAGTAVALNQPLSFLAVTIVGFGVLVGGVSMGFATGMAIKNVSARSTFIARHRLLANLLASMSLLAGYLLLVRDPGAVAGFAGALQNNPIGWPADFALISSPVQVPTWRAAVGAMGLFTVPLLAGLVTMVLSGWLWFADRAEPPDGQTDDSSALDRSLAAFEWVGLSLPIRAVAIKSLRRIRRAPYTAQYAILPLFFLFSEVQAIVATGTVPPRLPAIVGLAGAWATGALFTLNPIGDEEPVLPVTLTSGVSGRAVLAGRHLAGILVGLPITLIAIGATTAVGELAVPGGVRVAVATVLLCLATPGIAAAAGVRFPKRDPTTIARGRELRLPSPWAFVGYSAVVAVIGLPVVVVHLSGFDTMMAGYSLPSVPYELLGPVVSGILAAVIGGAAWTDAAARLGRVRLD